MYIVLWEYIVRAGHEFEFEKIYGPNGEWAELFKHSDGYLGTDLIRDADTPRRYITIDRWVSSSAYDAFQEKFQASYEELDARCESLTENENRIGSGETFSSTGQH